MRTFKMSLKNLETLLFEPVLQISITCVKCFRRTSWKVQCWVFALSVGMLSCGIFSSFLVFLQQWHSQEFHSVGVGEPTWPGRRQLGRRVLSHIAWCTCHNVEGKKVPKDKKRGSHHDDNIWLFTVSFFLSLFMKCIWRNNQVYLGNASCYIPIDKNDLNYKITVHYFLQEKLLMLPWHMQQQLNLFERVAFILLQQELRVTRHLVSSR